MTKKEIIKKVEKFTRIEMGKILGDKDIHGWGHVNRVRKWALKINKIEKKVDFLILETTALLHDTGRVQINQKYHCKAGEKTAREFLIKLNFFSEEEIKFISQSIRNHDCGDDTDLTKILQDADRLDLVGAVGLTRVAMQHHSLAIYRNKRDFESKNYVQDEVDAIIRKPKKEKNLIQLYNLHISILRNQMNTETGKKLALIRIKHDEKFIKNLKKDLLV